MKCEDENIQSAWVNAFNGISARRSTSPYFLFECVMKKNVLMNIIGIADANNRECLPNPRMPPPQAAFPLSNCNSPSKIQEAI